MNKETWVVMAGTPMDGFSFVGPFNHIEKAFAYANTLGTSGDKIDWWVVKVERP